MEFTPFCTGFAQVPLHAPDLVGVPSDASFISDSIARPSFSLYPWVSTIELHPVDLRKTMMPTGSDVIRSFAVPATGPKVSPPSLRFRGSYTPALARICCA